MYRRLPEPGTIDFRRAEASWKKNIWYTHRFFCTCPDWKLHFATWPGYQERSGSGDVTGTTGDAHGPLDGASIKGRGLTDEDIKEAVGAAVHFHIDDPE
nr:MAG: ORF2 [Giant panda anellovirus]